MTMQKYITPKSLISFCPFCGLVPDVSFKHWTRCHNCERSFMVFCDEALADNGSKSWLAHCGEKRAHPSIAAALEHAEELIKRGDERGGKKELSIYRCLICEFFHIGHHRKPRKWQAKEAYTIEEAREQAQL